MGEWKSIETAPKTGVVDLWCYKYELVSAAGSETRKLERRFPDCHWVQPTQGMTSVVQNRVGNNFAQQMTIDQGNHWSGHLLTHEWTPTHWMLAPSPPTL